ncbi:MAG: hypothetical protein Q4D16_13290 [Eubacteriales bacterium]|nr:hypothetical protein [Eubacteriales bacterium]
MKKRLLACMLAFTMMLTSVPAMASAVGMEDTAVFSSSETEVQMPEENLNQQAEFSAQEPLSEQVQEAGDFTDGRSRNAGGGVEEAEEGALLSAAQYVVLRLRLPLEGQPGQYDDQADLSGLSFVLYEKDSNDPGAWVQKTTAVSSFALGYNVYKIDFNYVGNEIKDYKVVLLDNPFYEMQDAIVTSNNSYVPTDTLELTKKASAADDNTDALIDGWPGSWNGTGADNDVYTISGDVGTNLKVFTVRTVNTQAVISYEGKSYTGKCTFDIPYGTNTFPFTVTSKDESKTSYYSVTITRPKFNPGAPQGLKGEFPTAMGGNDGKITGLDTSKIYEYKKDGEQDYQKTSKGDKEIAGLTAGTYKVRLAETDTWNPSPDATVVVPEPILHTITPPDDSELPDGVKILEIPQTMVEGGKLKIKIELPLGRLIEEVRYYYSAGGWEANLPFWAGDFTYSEENGKTILTIDTDAPPYDITLKIFLKDGTYHQVTTAPEGAEYTVKVTGGDKTTQGKLDYYKSGSEIIVTAALKNNWINYGEISSLTALKKGTTDPIEEITLDSGSKDTWTLTVTVNEDMDIDHSITVYPADFTELDAVLIKIGSLDKYIDNQSKKSLQERFRLLDAYRKLPLKQQSLVDDYVKLLEEDYKGLVIYVPVPSPLDNMPPGSILLPDGSIQTPNGTVIKPDGTIILPDETVLSPGEDGKKPSIDKQENVTDVNGTVIDSEGNVTLPNTDPDQGHTEINKGDNGERPKYDPETGTVTTAEGNTVVQPDGNKVQPPAGSVVQPDGTVTYPDGTTVQPDGTIHGADGSIIGKDGTVIRPAAPVIKTVNVTGNKAAAILEGESAGAQGYDFVISENINCIVDKDYLQVKKNILLTKTDFYYVQKGTYYAYCHSWIRDENGKKKFSIWSEPYLFNVTAETPDTPRIVSVSRKGNTVQVTFTRCKNASGYDVILGRERKKVNGEMRPVDYSPYVIKEKGRDKVTVTFKNVEKGTYFAGVHAWNRSSEDQKKVFSPWSNQKKVIVK